MPNVKPDESREEYLGRCIPAVLREGTTDDSSQAAAICHSKYDEFHKKGLSVSIAERIIDAVRRGAEKGTGKRNPIEDVIEQILKGGAGSGNYGHGGRPGEIGGSGEGGEGGNYRISTTSERATEKARTYINSHPYLKALDFKSRDYKNQATVVMVPRNMDKFNHSDADKALQATGFTRPGAGKELQLTSESQRVNYTHRDKDLSATFTLRNARGSEEFLIYSSYGRSGKSIQNVIDRFIKGGK